MQDSFSIQDFTSFASVAIAAWYALLTWRIAKVNEQTLASMAAQNEAALRPYVSVGIVLSQIRDSFFLRVANTGKGHAESLRLRLDRDYFPFGEASKKSLASRQAFMDVIEHFQPGAELWFELGPSWIVLKEDQNKGTTPSRFTVEAQYSFHGKVVTEHTKVDLRPYLESSHAQAPNIQAMLQIKDAVEKCSPK